MVNAEGYHPVCTRPDWHVSCWFKWAGHVAGRLGKRLSPPCVRQGRRPLAVSHRPCVVSHRFSPSLRPRPSILLPWLVAPWPAPSRKCKHSFSTVAVEGDAASRPVANPAVRRPRWSRSKLTEKYHARIYNSGTLSANSLRTAPVGARNGGGRYPASPVGRKPHTRPDKPSPHPP